MARPGFVLDVDERTPPLRGASGDTFRLERFPLGTRVVYPADSCPALLDLAEATTPPWTPRWTPPRSAIGSGPGCG